MITRNTLQYLKELKKNNNKNWFDEHRALYEEARTNFASLVESLITRIGNFDAMIAPLQVKECIFRINRDVRFSKDKTPYKVNMAASFSAGGKKASVAGYYFHLEPGRSFAGGGFYTPEPGLLAKIRQEIDYNFNEWEKIVHAKAFQQHFKTGIEGNGSLVRPPKGYDENNPAVKYLKMKGYIVTEPFSDAELMEKNAVENIARSFKSMKPLIDFLNTAIQ